MSDDAEPAGKARLTEVARLAGVSGMTVSRVLNGHPHVSEKTRAKVLDAVQSLGYVPNRLAGALTSARTRLVVVLIPSLSNIVFPEVLRGANERLEAAGYQAVIGVTDYDPGKEERLIEAMQAWRPAGWIVTGLEHSDRARQLLREAGTPVVEVMDTDGTPIDMAVGISHRGAGQAMGQFLVDSGRRRIGYVGGNLDRDLRAAKRLDGFCRALEDRGLALAGWFTDEQPSSVLLGRWGLSELLTWHPDLDAVYFSNDDMAVGGLMHCLSAGIAVPGRLALAGFNGLDIGQATPQPLTTARTPRHAIGAQAAGQILDRLAGRAPEACVDLGLTFVRGETA